MDGYVSLHRKNEEKCRSHKNTSANKVKHFITVVGDRKTKEDDQGRLDGVDEGINDFVGLNSMHGFRTIQGGKSCGNQLTRFT